MRGTVEKQALASGSRETAKNVCKHLTESNKTSFDPPFFLTIGRPSNRIQKVGGREAFISSGGRCLMTDLDPSAGAADDAGPGIRGRARSKAGEAEDLRNAMRSEGRRGFQSAGCRSRV